MAWTLSANAFFNVCQYGILVGAARLGNREMVGEFSFALAVTTPIAILCQLQLRSVQVTDAREDHPFGEYLGLRLLSTSTAILISAGVALASSWPGRVKSLVGVIAIKKGVDAIVDIYQGRWQQQERLDWVSHSLILNGVTTTALFVTALLVSHQIVVASISSLGGSLLALLHAEWLSRRHYSDKRGKSRFRTRQDTSAAARRYLVLLATTTPLAIAGAVASFNANLPRYFLDATHGKSVLALYAVAATPLAAIGLVNQALGLVATPRTAKLFATGEMRETRSLALRVSAIQTGVAIVFTAGAFVAGAVILEWLFGREYVEAAPILVILAVAQIFAHIAAFGLSLLTAMREFGLQLAINLSVLALQVPVLWYFCARYGAAGAAWAEVVKSVLMLLLANALALQRLSRRLSIRSS